jgi:hypothetical protein
LIKLIIFGSLVAFWLIVFFLTILPFGYNKRIEERKQEEIERGRQEVERAYEHWEYDEIGKIEKEIADIEKATKM